MKILKRKKLLFSAIGVFFLVLIFGISGIRLNNYLEWKIAERTIATSGLSTQLGVINSVIIPCFPSCQTPAGIATCCGPQANMCITVVPTNATFETTCPMYADVEGTPAGGMGNIALLSALAIGKAGLTNGGQFIYGGTTNNMSMMTVADPNVVLASAGGCYNCMAKADWKENLKTKFIYFIAGFKD